MSRISKKKRFFSGRNKYVFIGLAITALAAVFVFSYLSNNKTATGTIQSTSSNRSSADSTQLSGSGSTGSNTNTSSQSSYKTQSGSSSDTSNLKLVSGPTGAFVSNHRPSISGNGSPSEEQSACNTLAGATCYIQFSKEAETKSLDAKIADQDGNVIWNWDVKTSGLTQGEWTITAIASLNGQTKSSTDSLKLVVEP